MEIHNARQLRDAIANGPYAWPGGYPLFFVMADGGTLCPGCAFSHRGFMAAGLSDRRKFGMAPDTWTPAAIDINYEDPELYCDHCELRIESAYAEPDAEE